MTGWVTGRRPRLSWTQALAGIGIGLAASRAFASVLQPLLFATSATNPATALVTATVVLVATFAATAGPIGRVARLAPAPVLRE
jgi:ABC-type antimicrobial peptide transport system permease subunit